MHRYTIFGIHVHDHSKTAKEVQDILTEYGCNIQTRVGVHQVQDNTCSPNGVILIQFLGDEEKAGEFQSSLESVEGVEVQKMLF